MANKYFDWFRFVLLALATGCDAEGENLSWAPEPKNIKMDETPKYDLNNNGIVESFKRIEYTI